jgi:hypothetical protein
MTNGSDKLYMTRQYNAPEVINCIWPDNTMAKRKGQNDKEWPSKHYTES